MTDTTINKFGPWDDARIARLRELFHNLVDDRYYYSYRWIGEIMKLSRNAIMGKVDRLEWTRDPNVSTICSNGTIHVPFHLRPVRGPKVIRRRPAVKRGARPVSRGVVAPTVSLVDPAPEGRSPYACQCVDLTAKVCHYPLGHVGDPEFHFCGAPSDKEPYCAYHYGITHFSGRQRPNVRWKTW